MVETSWYGSVDQDRPTVRRRPGNNAGGRRRTVGRTVSGVVAYEEILIVC